MDIQAKSGSNGVLPIVTTPANGSRHHAESALQKSKQGADTPGPCTLHGMIGNTPKMRAIFDRIIKVSETDANVLVIGESGTGKELVARAIHACSKRAQGAFVPVDCVALPGSLLESELFGYERGAFTGAEQAKKGLLEIADQGTFFLDEVSELPPELQAKLLRVLQERSFRHLGGKALVHVDIRVIAATNRNPLQAIRRGALREDLYYRLNVIPIHLPPLRDRREDIPLLTEYFLKLVCQRNRKPAMALSKEAARMLRHYRWPGNIRELQNVVERVVSLSSAPTIRVSDLPDYIRNQGEHEKSHDLTGLPLREARRHWLEKFERKYLIDLIHLYNGNISEVARKAGVNRMTIYRMLKKYKINRRMQFEESYVR